MYYDSYHAIASACQLLFYFKARLESINERNGLLIVFVVRHNKYDQKFIVALE